MHEAALGVSVREPSTIVGFAPLVTADVAAGVATVEPWRIVGAIDDITADTVAVIVTEPSTMVG